MVLVPRVSTTLASAAVANPSPGSSTLPSTSAWGSVSPRPTVASPWTAVARQPSAGAAATGETDGNQTAQVVMIRSRREMRPRWWVIIVNTLQALRKAGSSHRRPRNNGRRPFCRAAVVLIGA